MKKIIYKAQLILITLALGACASGPRYGGNVGYVDPNSVEQTTNEFSMSDIGMVAETMSRKMLQSPAIAQSKEIVRIQVTDVKNLTAEYINTATITNKIKNVLVNSGKVEFAGSKDQNQAGLYDSKTTAQMGKMQGAKYRVEGSLTSMTQRGSVKSISYNFNLSLIDIQRNVMVWGEDTEIRKVSGR